MAFLPYERELADPSPPNERNAYPYAYRRLVSLFADPDRSPDLAVVHTPSALVRRRGRARRASTDRSTSSSRARRWCCPAPGSQRLGYVDEHAWLVDVGPTLAAAAGVPLADLLVDAARPSAWTASALTHLVRPGRRKVVGILWDGGHCGDLLHLAESGELPGVARLIERGTALRGGAVAHFPSITLTNHTSILTGVGPGPARRAGQRLLRPGAPASRSCRTTPTTWHRSGEWLRPGVRTVFEMVHDNVPARIDGSPRTASVDEAIDRGADYSTMGGDPGQRLDHGLR